MFRSERRTLSAAGIDFSQKTIVAIETSLLCHNVPEEGYYVGRNHS